MVYNYISRLSSLPKVAIAILLAIVPTNLATADTSSTDYLFLVDRDRQACQQMGISFQEIKAFETPNYRIHICQKDNNYYYWGETKTGAINTIFLPANALESGDIYQASNGNITYIVTILPNEALLTIERNGAQVVAESSLNNSACINMNDLSQIQDRIASKTHYPLSDVPVISTRSYVEINQLDMYHNASTSNFDNQQFLSEYNPEAALNLRICD